MALQSIPEMPDIPDAREIPAMQGSFPVFPQQSYQQVGREFTGWSCFPVIICQPAGSGKKAAFRHEQPVADEVDIRGISKLIWTW